jgi:para-nitrobenzyl esterase
MVERRLLLPDWLPIAWLLCAPPWAAAGSLDVQLDAGRIAGSEQLARAWQGIPYAAPPTGALRWRAPVPAPAWSGVRDATQAGPPCAQGATDAHGTATLAGSEDCLTLNVYAPRVAAGAALPVMVWIHGGGQLAGTGNAYDGSRLADSEQLIVVSVNYRLGPFGWFHHPAITREGGVPVTGQFALQDLLAALQWVQRNIAAFGGDPRRVTLFGQSAGAQNIYALLLAPAARGLFHGAIAESGGLWNMTLDQAVNYRDAPVPGTPLSAREVVDRLAVASGKAADAQAARAWQLQEPPAALADWLRSLPAATLVAPYGADAHAGYDFPSVVYDGMLLPGPDHALQLGRGDANEVPVLIGGNRNEDKDFLWQDDALVRRQRGRLQIRHRREYAALDRLYSGWWNAMAVDELLPLLHAPAFAYRFDWDDEPTAPTDLRALYGAAHGLELPFVFGDFRFAQYHDELPPPDGAADPTDPFTALFNEANRTSRERTSAAMMSYWAEFARTGRPGTGSRHELPAWNSWQDSGRKLIFATRGIRTEAGLLTEAALLRDLATTRDLSQAQKCAVLTDNTMYPAYPLELLARWHCAR